MSEVNDVVGVGVTILTAFRKTKGKDSNGMSGSAGWV